MKKLKKVRMGVIGCGSMAQSHMKYFGEVEGLEFVAAADGVDTALEQAVKEYGVEGFSDGEKLIKSGLVDAVLIATPHFFHPPLSIAAFKAGVHVLVEKPVAVTAYDAERVDKAHQKVKTKVAYAAMFNQRTMPGWRKVKELIDAGEIGKITRTNWIITNWFRTQAYYDSGGWRATWAGEGGGVLLNQCPHNLDLFQWFCGMPSRVTANIGIGKFHKIEVEDDVTAILEYPNGATGVFVTSTGDSPGTNRLEITGDGGKIIAEGGNKVELIKNHEPTSKFLKTSPERFGGVGNDHYTITANGPTTQHKNITTNFINHLCKGEKLIAPATEGIHGLELGNAMLMSGLTGKPVDIPTPRKKFHDMLADMAKKSTFKKPKPKTKSQKVDMNSSF